MLEMLPDSKQIESTLREAKSILLVDWPSRALPRGLARAGYEVTAHVGPGPLEYSRYEAQGAEIVVRRGVDAPSHVDIVHVFRPLEELCSIAAMSKTIGASAIWFQSGLADGGARDPTGCWLNESDSARARDIVESQGLLYIQCPHILEAIAPFA
jgi:predicted CoA-binding protein